MAIRLSVEGAKDKVKKLMSSIQNIPQWRFYSGSKFKTGRNEIHVDYFIDEHLYLKPTISVKKVSKLLITAKDGAQIKIDLLDANVADMGNGVTVIYGKGYDIFAAPKRES
jgi:hypothetical protein